MRPAKTRISLGHPPSQRVAKDRTYRHTDSDDSDQTGRMPRPIWVFTGRTGHFAGFAMWRIICGHTRILLPSDQLLLFLIVMGLNPCSLHFETYTRKRYTVFFFFFFFFFCIYTVEILFYMKPLYSTLKHCILAKCMHFAWCHLLFLPSYCKFYFSHTTSVYTRLGLCFCTVDGWI